MIKFVLATALLAFATVAAFGQTGKFYGPTGDYLGSYNITHLRQASMNERSDR
jgi:hypothetical protein